METGFTTGPPDSKMFADRGEIQEDVTDAISDPVLQVVLHGPTGVGKTSLVLRICQDLGKVYLKVPCDKAGLDSALDEVLARLGIPETVEHTSTDGKSAGAAIGLRMVGVKGDLKHEVATKTTPRAVSRNRAVIDGLWSQGYDVLFLDNFERTINSAESVLEMATGIEELVLAFADRADELDGAPKLVIAGIPAAAGDLMSLDSSVNRRIAQIPIPRMTDREIESILDLAEPEVQLTFSDEARAHFVRSSQGTPYILHLLGKRATTRAKRGRRDEVSVSDVDAAINWVVEKDGLTLKAEFDRAVAGHTDFKARSCKLAVRALARAGELEVAWDDLVAAYSDEADITGQTPPGPALANALIALEERGVICSRLKAEGSRGLHKYRLFRFSHPLMRVYVLLQREMQVGSRTMEQSQSQAAPDV